MITINQISKIYKTDNEPFYALNKVSLNVKNGEMIAIQGRSGAGKSTLLHILGCLDTFDEGRYELAGQDIGGKTASELAKIRNEKIGFVLQDFSLINHQTALYNVKAPMLFNKTPFRDIKDRALNALECVGVANQAGKKVENMSGGQRQRVAIARALVNDPPLILADEPTGNLDSNTSKEIMGIFKELNDRGKTVIIVTHDDSVAECCSRKIIISDGRIINRDENQ